MIWGCPATSAPGRLAVIYQTMKSALWQNIENLFPSFRSGMFIIPRVGDHVGSDCFFLLAANEIMT